MRKFLYWIPTILFYLVFMLILLVFHPLQMLGLRMGYIYHKRTVDAMIWCINHSLLLVGSRIRYDWHVDCRDLPKDKPLILVSNHQSMFDIPTIGWAFRRHHPKYIAKESLAKGIPSISYNIRHGGSIAINRKERTGALAKIDAFADYLNTHNRAGTIFPEGTRSRDGSMKPFKPGGLLQLLERMPDAVVIPVALSDYWKLARYGMKPIPFGCRLTCTLLPPVERAGSVEEVARRVEHEIRTALGQEPMAAV